jgi:hypothetical protein
MWRRDPPRVRRGRHLVYYVKYAHRYQYQATPMTPQRMADEMEADQAERAGLTARSSPRSPDDIDSCPRLGWQLYESVFQSRIEFRPCVHNFAGPMGSSSEYRDFIHGLPHHQRECYPCEICIGVVFRHYHPCPPLVLEGLNGAPESHCNSHCIASGLRSRILPSLFRELHHCPSPPPERSTRANIDERRVPGPSGPVSLEDPPDAAPVPIEDQAVVPALPRCVLIYLILFHSDCRSCTVNSDILSILEDYIFVFLVIVWVVLGPLSSGLHTLVSFIRLCVVRDP